MDLANLAQTAVTALSPIMAQGAQKLAETALSDVYTAIKERLRREPSGKAALEKFEQSPNEGALALEAELVKRLATDAELARLLAESLEKSGAAAPGSLVGRIDAQKVVVAKKIDIVNM